MNAIPEQCDLIGSWIDNCIDNHPNCRAAQRGFRPTRLLQIDCFNTSKDVRLVESGSDGAAVPYVALSHCWGPPSKRPIITTRENISSHRNRIPFEALSRTFRDAVTITRELGQSYLWIDSLCIVQDDGDDWAREAALMAEVYRESFCTVAAHSARDGDDGCRINASNETVEPVRYVDLDVGEYRIRLFDACSAKQFWALEWDTVYGEIPYNYVPFGSSALGTRAWALQERELSVRTIHFSRSTLLWECLQMKGSTEIPHDVFDPFNRRKPGALQPPSLETRAAAQNRWYRLVENYSARSLTVESDKLPAMAGLAMSFRSETLKNGTYLAGLWREHLPGALLWEVRTEFQTGGSVGRSARRSASKRRSAASKPRRPSHYRAPSWSWAGLDGEITYASQKVAITNGEATELPQSQIAFREASLGVADPYLFQAPQQASITVHGQITQATIETDPPWARVRVDANMRWLYDDDGDKIGRFYPDIMDEVHTLEKVTCLSVCYKNPFPFAGKHEQCLMGLALLPDPKGLGTFRRVGFIRELEKSAFENIVSVDITIV